MKTVVIVLDVLTGLFLFSTVVCGLWMKAQATVDPGSIAFHQTIGLVTAVLVVVTLVVTTVALFRLS